MTRSPRILLTEGRVVEVTSRTLLGMFLTRPSQEVNDLILGVLGRAQALFPVELFAFVFMSNHFHLLMRVLSAERMAQFTGFLKSNIALELGRLHDWKAKFWSGRYDSAPVGDSEAAQLKRFQYILKNGSKEGLVASPLDWVGANSTPALHRGERELTGTWYDRTAEYYAKVRGVHKLFPYKQTVHLSPLPFLEGMSAEEQRAFIVAEVQALEQETKARHEENNTRPAGAAAILRVHPHSKPDDFHPSPGPAFHAASPEEFMAMKEARAAILAEYRAASARLRAGEDNVEFPEGTFPPAAPFLDDSDSRAPP